VLVEFRLLGPVDARLDGRRVDLGHSRRLCVLVALLVDANTVVSPDQLVDRVWGERAPARAHQTLYSYLSRIRQALAGAGDIDLERRPGGYLLAVDPPRVDLHRFHALLDQARTAGDDGAASAALREALGLWRGEAFAGLDTPWINALRNSVEAERFTAELDLAELQLRGGDHARVLALLAGRAETHPLDERLAGQLMLAWYRSGRQADALSYYERLRRQLADELGADPGPALQQLHQRILTADAALSAPVAAEPPWAVVPRQLPAPPGAFTGRTRELAELDRVDDAAAAPITAIAGMAGVGKTALAIHAAHRLADRFPDGQLYANLHGATAGLRPLEPLPVLGRFLRALGMEPGAVPTALEEASAVFRSRIADRRLLVVLDNAADAGQIIPLLPGASGCGVLVTSRRWLSSLDGARHLHLDTLDGEEAIELLARIAGQDRLAAEPEAATEVVRWCGSLPLALRIAGARLAMRPGWPVAALAERLAQAQRRPDELELAEAGVRTSFAVSFEHLDASAEVIDRAAARAFGLLGILDGPEVGVQVAAPLLDQPEETAERSLERLVDAQLPETPSPGRYRMHDLLRLYARDLADRRHPEPVRAAALTRALGSYVTSAWRTLALLRPGDHRLARMDGRWSRGGPELADERDALGWLDVKRANLLAGVPAGCGHRGGARRDRDPARPGPVRVLHGARLRG
jgi:DNA-binding SARP family transcriptional activator